ncbi:MAG: TIGR02281 family clan AA aspartic protease [Cohaesibacteraceae bacterium]
MRAVALLVVGFALGFGSALGLFSSSMPGTGSLESTSQPARQVAAQAERPPVTGGDERFRLNRAGHVETYADIDGADMPVLIDTGATVVALRESDARRAGYRLRDRDFTVPVQTANGTKLAAPIVLRSVEIGSIRVRNVDALVSRDDQLSTNLLGMSFLGRLDGFRFHNGHLVLEN